jgi:Repeat of unknown function (DUF5648)
MSITRFAQIALACLTTFALLSCGGGSDVPTIAATAVSDAKLDKAAGDTVPVYRFAKISNGAYFYTSSQAEFETINTSYPDFRYEGVAFQALVSGGVPVFRYAKTDTGAYFYTTSVDEKNYIAANFPNFRDEGEAFRVPDPTGSPMYRLANLSNGAYLYTASLEEYNYAQTVGFRGEGEKFKVPGGLLLSGTVFDGVPWVQATVSLIDDLGAKRSAVTDKLGNYSIDVTGMTAPIGVSATYKQPGAIFANMLAVLETLPANATATTLNITPLTTQIYAFSIGVSKGPSTIRSYTPVAPTRVFTGIPSSNPSAIAPTTAAQRVVLSNYLTANGLSATDFDPAKLPFATTGTGQAAVIRDVALTEIGRGYWFANRRTANPDEALYFAPTNPPFPSAAPIAAPSKPAFPQATLDTYKEAWKACLAIPAAQRVTLDANQNISSIHPTCAAIGSSAYLLSGDNFGTYWKTLLSHPGFDQNAIDHVMFRDYADIDGKELAGVYVRALATDGRTINQLEIFRKVNGAWVVDGNQQVFNGRIVARANNQQRAASPTVAAFNRSRHELQFVADPDHPSLAQVRAIRVKGPGLPTQGLVWARSTVCGTATYFAIHNKLGDVANVQYTDFLAGAFVMNQEGGATYPSTPPLNYSDLPQLTAYSTIKPHSQYTVEYFSFQNPTSTTPIATYTATLNGVVKVSGASTTDVLPQIDVTFINNYLRNSGSAAAAQTTVPVAWALPTSISELLFTSTSRNTAQTLTTAPDYNFVTESRLAAGWVGATATSANMVVTADSMKSGTSVNATTSALPTTANSTCANQPLQIRALTDLSAGREVVIRHVMPDLTRMQRDYFWQN